MAVANLTVDLSASTANFKLAMDNATRQLESFGKSADGVMARVKKSLGGRSDFKDVVELFKGGGAVAGLTLAGHVLESMTKRAKELKDQYQAGEVSAGQMVEELARAIPVYGKIIAAGRNIREMITGDEAALKAANKAAAEMAALSERIAGGFRKSAESVADLRRSLWERRLEVAASRSAPPFDKLIADQLAGARRVQSIRDDVQKRIAPILNPSGAKAFDDLMKERDRLRRIATQPIPGPEMKWVTVGDGPSVEIADYTQQHAVKRQVAAAKESLSIVERELKSRVSAANEIIAQGNKNIAFEIQTGWQNWSTTFVKTAKDAWKGIMDANSKANSPFKLIDDVRQQIASGMEKARQRVNIWRGASGFDDVVNGLVSAWNRPAEKVAQRPRMTLPSPVVPAREFYFTEGIPGRRANPIERQQKAMEDNTREVRRNNERLRENNELLRRRPGGGDVIEIP